MGLRFISLAVFCAFGAFAAGPPELERAQSLYNHTDFSAAVDQLLPIARENAAAAELLGRTYYVIGEYCKASNALEKAVALDGSRATAYLWLARAYGRRAETSYPPMSIRYAKKAKSNFEKSVQLDSGNLEAVSDLLEFYLQAPGLLGGGYDKAERMAAIIAVNDPAEGSFALARIAEERNDYSSAEALLRRAIELAPHRIGRMLDLAKLLANEGRFAESDAVFAQAHRVEPGAPRLLFTEASTYLKHNRRNEDARQLLTQYLAANISPEDPAKSEARKLLKQASRS